MVVDIIIYAAGGLFFVALDKYDNIRAPKQDSFILFFFWPLVFIGYIVIDVVDGMHWLGEQASKIKAYCTQMRTKHKTR